MGVCHVHACIVSNVYILTSFITIKLRECFHMITTKSPWGITRRFSNHESHLLSRSHTFAIIVILDLTPYLLRWYVQSTQGSWCPSLMNQRSLTPRWPVCWGHMSDSTQGLLCPSPMKIHQSMWIQWPFFQKLEPKVIDSRWPLTTHLLRSHMWLYPRIIVSMSHGNTSMYVDTVINLQITTYILHTKYYIHMVHTT